MAGVDGVAEMDDETAEKEGMCGGGRDERTDILCRGKRGRDGDWDTGFARGVGLEAAEGEREGEIAELCATGRDVFAGLTERGVEREEM